MGQAIKVGWTSLLITQPLDCECQSELCAVQDVDKTRLSPASQQNMHLTWQYFMQELGWKRSDYVLSTKIFWGGKGVNDKGLSRKHIIEGMKVGRPVLNSTQAFCLRRMARRLVLLTPCACTCPCSCIGRPAVSMPRQGSPWTTHLQSCMRSDNESDCT